MIFVDVRDRYSPDEGRTVIWASRGESWTSERLREMTEDTGVDEREGGC